MTRPLDALTEIKQLYYATTKATVVRDLDRAIDLLKGLPTEEHRERAAVYMDGLAQMRSEWGVKSPAAAPGRAGSAAGPKKGPGATARPPRGGRGEAARRR